MKINSEEEMIDYGWTIGDAFVDEIVDHCMPIENERGELIEGHYTRVLELIGDVGVGKTTLVRGIAEGMEISEPVTSPSYTISKVYESPYGTLTHYDFYRLDDPGLMTEDLEEAMMENGVVIIEWAEAVEGVLPKGRAIIEIIMNNDGGRTLNVYSDEEEYRNEKEASKNRRKK